LDRTLLLSRVLRVAAWLAFISVAIVTLSPVGLRPRLALPGLEYLAALAVVGGLFGLAYPRRPVLAAVLILAAVAGLELSQMLTGDRHARLSDLAFKAAGGLVGLAAGVLLARLLLRAQDRRGA
jgi:hypothetical protein